MDRTLNHKIISIELVKLLYKQLPLALWSESAAAVGFVLAQWSTINHHLLMMWLLSNLLICGLSRHLLIFYYHKYTANQPLSYRTAFTWGVLFGLGALLSGISWSIVASFLFIQNDTVRQTFTLFLLVGVMFAANSFYSAIRTIYALFLLPVGLVLSIWLFLKGGIFFILGLLAVVFIIIMLVTSFYLHHVIAKSFTLRFENLELLKNLAKVKNSLEVYNKNLEKSLSLVNATLESTTDGIIVINSESKVENFNQKFLYMWSIPASFLENQPIEKIVHFVLDQVENKTECLAKINELEKNPDMEGFAELKIKGGRTYEYYSRPQYVGVQAVGRVWSFRDITHQKSLEEKLFHQANYDILTQLPNRALLMERINQAINTDKKSKLKLAIIFIDLDQFKLINDTLGHILADQLLKLIAKRLLRAVREIDTVSRIGGDEFVIVLSSLNHEKDCISIAQKILESLRKPFLIDIHQLHVTASIGISFYPKDGEDPEMLIKNADIAMYRGKEAGRDNFQLFSDISSTSVTSLL